MQLLRKLFGKLLSGVDESPNGDPETDKGQSLRGHPDTQSGGSHKPSSYYVVPDRNPEAAKRHRDKILGILDKVEEDHRGAYLVMHTTVPDDLLDRCRNEVSEIQRVFNVSLFLPDVEHLGSVDFGPFRHLSIRASGNEGLVARQSRE